MWSYIQFLLSSQAAATKAQSFVQALRFAHYRLSVTGALSCVESRRIVGMAELQLANKAITWQARPLSVCEVKLLHAASCDLNRPLADSVASSHLLLMLYGRCRSSDLANVHEVLHDMADEAGFVQVTMKFHKGAKSAAKKALLLSILISPCAVRARYAKQQN